MDAFVNSDSMLYLPYVGQYQLYAKPNCHVMAWSDRRCFFPYNSRGNDPSFYNIPYPPIPVSLSLSLMIDTCFMYEKLCILQNKFRLLRFIFQGSCPLLIM